MARYQGDLKEQQKRQRLARAKLKQQEFAEAALLDRICNVAADRYETSSAREEAGERPGEAISGVEAGGETEGAVDRQPVASAGCSTAAEAGAHPEGQE